MKIKRRIYEAPEMELLPMSFRQHLLSDFSGVGDVDELIEDGGIINGDASSWDW